MTNEAEAIVVEIIIGSASDFETMKHCSTELTRLGIRHRVGVISAHRTPEWLPEYAKGAEARGVEIIIAAAGGAAALPGDTACETVIPVLGVPMDTVSAKGLDSLLSIAQLPAGTHVGTLGIGVPGAINAAGLTARILGTKNERLRAQLRKDQVEMRAKVLKMNRDLPLSGLAEPIPIDWLPLEEKPS